MADHDSNTLITGHDKSVVSLNATRISKPASTTKKPMATLSGAPRKPNVSVFGPCAPPAQLRFPQNQDLTAVEIITFCPNWVRSHDVLYRLVQNGMDTPTLAQILNYHRQSAGGYTVMGNSLCKILQKTMRESEYEGWTVRKHHAGDFADETEEWAENNLALTDFKLNCEDFPQFRINTDGVIENVLFASLADDIEQFPSEENGDALNLTRCTKFAAANAHLLLRFPRDFEFLVELTGGPSDVQYKHYDRSVFRRWDPALKTVKRIVRSGIKIPPNVEEGDFTEEDYLFTDDQMRDVVQYLESVEGRLTPQLDEVGHVDNEDNMAWSLVPSFLDDDHKLTNAEKAQKAQYIRHLMDNRSTNHKLDGEVIQAMFRHFPDFHTSGQQTLGYSQTPQPGGYTGYISPDYAPHGSHVFGKHGYSGSYSQLQAPGSRHGYVFPVAGSVTTPQWPPRNNNSQDQLPYQYPNVHGPANLGLWQDAPSLDNMLGDDDWREFTASTVTRGDPVYPSYNNAGNVSGYLGNNRIP